MEFFARRAISALAFAAVALLPCLAPSAAPAAEAPPWLAVTDQRLANAAADDGWLMYRRTYDSSGFAPFDQINSNNVAQLAPAFTYKTDLPQGHEAAPVINGRYMFVTTPLDHVIALEATTGRVLWTYVPEMSRLALLTVCCDVVNRGVAVYGDRVFLERIDNHVVALDAKSGAVTWDRALAAVGKGNAMTSAPLVVAGKVIVGVSAGEYGARGFIAALDPQTGSELWRRYTIPAAGEKGSETWPPAALPRGGGGAWLTGSYDAATQTLLWGVGNPGPWRSDVRQGTNLYSDSVLALDPRDGSLKWSFQFTPHDEWDYDGVNENVLADITHAGRKIHALLHADRNGHFVVLDRRNGRFVYSVPLVKTTAVLGYDPTGKALIDPAARATAGHPARVCPSAIGGTNWWPPSYDAGTGLFYVPLSHMCMSVAQTDLLEMGGAPYLGETLRLFAEPDHPNFGELLALDAATGRRRWSFPTADPLNGGILSTAGGLVFTGTPDQQLLAFDAATGRVVWRYPLSSGVVGVPVTYRVDGKQYVAVFAGWGGGVALFGGPAADVTSHVPRGGELYVFALP